MHYSVIYQTATGAILGYRVSENAVPPESLPEDCAVLALSEDRPPVPELQSVDLVSGELVDVPVPEEPAIFYAQWVDIKNCREQFEQFPIDTPHGLLDADLSSMERLRLAIKQFLFLPTVQNGKLAWKMADNTIEQFTYLELQGLYEEADKARSIRAAYLHVRAEELAAMDPAPTLDFISDINNWIEP